MVFDPNYYPMMDPKADPYLPFKNSLMPRGDPYTDPFYAYKMPVATGRPTYYYSDSGSPSTYSYGYEDITRGYTFDATAKLWRLFAPADQGEFGGFGLGIGVTQDAAKADFCSRYSGGKAAATCIVDASSKRADEILAKYLGGQTGQVPTPATAKPPSAAVGGLNIKYVILAVLGLFGIMIAMKVLK